MISCDKGQVVISGLSFIISAELSTLIASLVKTGMSKSEIVEAVQLAFEYPFGKKSDSSADSDKDVESDAELDERVRKILKEEMDNFWQFLED